MEKLKFYIGGAWVDPAAPSAFGVVNSATEETFAQISLGSSEDVDRAANVARRAFRTYSEVSVEDRLSYLHKIIEGFRKRLPELARMMTLEMGTPITFATQRQATEAVHPKSREIAWKAQSRLTARYRGLCAHGKKTTVVCIAIARELAGFMWAIGREVRTIPS